MEQFERIRRDHRDEDMSIRELAKKYRVHRRTVRQARPRTRKTVAVTGDDQHDPLPRGWGQIRPSQWGQMGLTHSLNSATPTGPAVRMRPHRVRTGRPPHPPARAGSGPAARFLLRRAITPTSLIAWCGAKPHSPNMFL